MLQSRPMAVRGLHREVSVAHLHSAIGGASSAEPFAHRAVAHGSTTEFRWMRRAQRAAAIAAWALVYATCSRVEAASAYEGFDYPVGTQRSGLTGGANFLPVSSNAESIVAP